jgi:hypothetical protein
MKSIAEALQPLEGEAQQRVMSWVSSQFSLAPGVPAVKISATPKVQRDADNGQLGVYSDFFDVCSPSTQAEKALTAAYWLKVHEGIDDVTGRQVNDLLRDVGHELTNVTVAFRNLEDKKPALARQSSKGKGKMGHKTYRITTAGDKVIFQMMKQAVEDDSSG